MGLNNIISTLLSKEAVTEPSYALIAIFTIVMIILYSQRIFHIRSTYYTVFITIIYLILTSIILTSTFLQNFHLGHPKADTYLRIFKNMFNSPGSKNFMMVFGIALFVFYMYEVPDYSNNRPDSLTDTVTFGYNRLISNRLCGILTILLVVIFTSYAVATTTRFPQD